MLGDQLDQTTSNIEKKQSRTYEEMQEELTAMAEEVIRVRLSRSRGIETRGCDLGEVSANMEIARVEHRWVGSRLHSHAFTDAW